MANRNVMTTVFLEKDDVHLTYIEVCQQCNLSESMLIEMVEHGLFQDGHDALHTMQFNSAQLRRLQSASRLLHDLNLNVPGVVLALELLDELDALRQEMCILQRHVKT